MTEEFKQKKLAFASINQLTGETFIIPDYQRGYRWQPTQVEQLLNDLWEFAHSHQFALSSEKSPYCLQPIVVSQREDGCWEVIDGQQRLTTIYLLLGHLNKSAYNIIYETRNEQPNSMDTYYRSLAQKVIENWFKRPIQCGDAIYSEEDLKQEFKRFLTHPEHFMAHFIWYNVTDEVKKNSSLAIDIFDRLNIGKIGLTNAELIKALFMTFVDRNTESETHKQLTQVRLGTEWDTIEKTLQQPLFWSFVYPKDRMYSTRIEYLFDIISQKKDDYEEKYTFNEYVKRLKFESVESLWKEVKQLFQQMEDWYQNPECFHYVGYLTSCGRLFQEILDLRFDKDGNAQCKNIVTQNLLNECKNTVKDYDLDRLDFYVKYSREVIRKILLLFNVLTITNSKDKSQHFMRFPFDEYRRKDENKKCIWDIEHIHSQTDKDIRGKDREEWIKTMIMYYTGKSEEDDFMSAINSLNIPEERELCSVLFSLLQKIRHKENVDSEFDNIYKVLRKKCESDESFDSVHSLGNLTLLDKWTNRSYQNAFFPVKRLIIIDNAKQGRFIPLCTQNVFMKAYSSHLGTLTEWKEQDCEDYLSEIKRVIL